MRNFILLFVIIFTITIMSSVSSAQNIQTNATLSFIDVVDNLDQTKNTSLYVKNYWKQIKGSEVTWEGTVQNVKGGRGKAQILIANEQRKTFKGYNIVLVTYNLEAATELKLNQELTFKGYIYNYKGRKGNPIIVYLDEVVIVKKPKK